MPVYGDGVQADALLSRFRTIQAKPDAQLDEMFADVMGAKQSYITTSPVTRSSLLSTYPAGASYLGKQAMVSDLWGGVTTTVVCEYDTLGGYYWRPLHPDFVQNIAVSQGAVMLIPLVTAPILSLVGTITGNITVTPSMANVWPGATFTVTVRGAVPALTTLNINGLVGGGTLPLVQGGTKTVRYTPTTGWQGD